MTGSLQQAKAELRRQLRAWLNERSAEERARASAAVRQRLVSRPEWHSARGVLLYAPLDDELDLWPLAARALAEGRLLALPRFNPGTGTYYPAAVREPERDLVPGLYGIREPAAHCPAVPLNQLDLLLVPGLCFDRAGRRLGRGRGYYDRLLAAPHGTACGVAWDRQVVARVPAGPDDQYVDCLVTPTRWLVLARRRTSQ